MLVRLVALLVTLLAVATPACAESVLETLNRQLADSVLIPGYQRFAATTSGLEAAVAGFCATPAPARLAAARLAFEAALDAWQRVQTIVFGPARTSARASIIELFPDARGAVPRQLGKALAARDPALVAAGGLDGKSVALTGLPALELLLYDDDAMPAPGTPSVEADYACALAAAIARNLAAQAEALLDEWQRPGGFRALVLTAAAGNDAYFSAEEATGDYLKSLHTTLQLMIAVKLEEPLGGAPDKAKPRRAESWRSGRSLANLRANLEVAEALYTAAGGFGDALLALTDEAQLDASIRQSLARAFEKLDAIDQPLPVAVEDGATRPRVEALVAELKALRLLVGRELAPALDLAIGFNALDGD